MRPGGKEKPAEREAPTLRGYSTRGAGSKGFRSPPICRTLNATVSCPVFCGISVRLRTESAVQRSAEEAQFEIQAFGRLAFASSVSAKRS